jgi:hypothetical protein
LTGVAAASRFPALNASALLRAAWLALSFFAFIAFSIFAFSRNYADLAYGSDGVFTFLFAIHAWKWAPVALGFGPYPFEGMSDVWCCENSFLLPGHLIYALIFGKPAEYTAKYGIVAYTIFAAELFLSVVVLARALGMRWLIAVVSAWILSLLAWPYFGFSLLYPISMTGPTLLGTTIAECTLLLAGVAYFVRKKGGSLRLTIWRGVRPLLAIIGLLFLLIASYPLRAILWIPAVSCVSLGLVLAAKAGQRLTKLLTLTGACFIALAAGGALFVWGMFSFTTPRFWAEALKNTISAPSTVSIWWGGPSIGPLGPQLFGFGVFGIVTAVVFGDRLLRGCASGLLLFVAAIFLLGYIALTFENWRGPQSVYFEFLVWPLYAIFAVWGVTYWLSRLAAFVSWTAAKILNGRNAGNERQVWAHVFPQHALTVILVLIVMAVPLYAFGRAWSVDNAKRIYPFPPTLTPMVRYLRNQVGLVPGETFRGRALTMDFTAKTDPVSWIDYANKLGPRYRGSGNDYFFVGLWYYDIPTLFEYSAATSPALFRTITYLLARPEDHQIRNVEVLRRTDPHALALLGVRFVIVEDTLPAPFRLVMTERTYGNEVLSLYEVPGVNLGTSSPTEVMHARSFDDALDRVKDASFDFRRSAVVFDPSAVSEPLQSADGAQVRMIRGGLTVEATSAGRSLLVLPFEFSQCLEAQTRSTDVEAPRLIRVNAIETGVLFNKRVAATIEYFTGLFRNPACRIRDSRDFSSLLSAE